MRLDALKRSERHALRALLVRATAAAGRPTVAKDLDRMAMAAPIEALPAAAALHRVAGSVLRGLDGVDGVPSGVRADLGALRGEASLRHLLTVGALSQIGRAFDEAGLSWVVMKGPVVAALLYPDVGDRSYSDLDLLVARQDFPLAMRLLEERGYQHRVHNWALAEAMLAGQITMMSQVLHVDLHWHLHYSREDRRPFAIDPEAMVRRARRVVVSGVTAPTLDPEDTLLTLAFHAARSDGHRLVWLKDVERAVAVDQPDLDELVRRCHQYRCAPPVGLILERALALLDAEIPPEIIRATAPRALRAVDRFVSALVDPVQMHERGTITRAFTRSTRSSFGASVTEVPVRGGRWLRTRLQPPAENESDSADEKASYLRAVLTSTS